MRRHYSLRRTLSRRRVPRISVASVSNDESGNDGGVEVCVNTYGIDQIDVAAVQETIELQGVHHGHSLASRNHARRMSSDSPLPMSEENSEDDVVKGKPTGRLWMKEVRSEY
jgi:hypothetical protein